MLRPGRAASVFGPALSLAALTLSLFAMPAAAGDRHDGDRHGHDRFSGLRPGEFVTHELKIPVRIVLIGFDEDAVDAATILALANTRVPKDGCRPRQAPEEQ